MKRFAPYILLSCMLFAAAPLAAKDTGPPPFNTIVVNHFTNANGVNLSQEFIANFCDAMRAQLQKQKIAVQALEEGAKVSGPAAAGSLVIEGKFTQLNEANAIFMGKLTMEISIYRISDHALVKTLTVKENFSASSHAHDTKSANFTGANTAFHDIGPALKGVNLSSIPPAPPGSNPASSAAPAPSSATAPVAAPAFASIQFSSNPTGAEIIIDGNYAGNTPSLIKLRPGTHSIRITKTGYTPWERSIEPGAGESRTVAATLEKTGP
ncbi:MAG: PEGA domain-containing protein [Terracidiphilus sp.]